jgi:uncharacterized membrane protein YgdD (TMEM256/DUF423 family)
MTRTAALLVFLAALNGLMAVLAGAWAEHGFVLPLIAGGDVLAEFGSRYQMWHALALLGIGLTLDRAPAARVLLVLASIALIIGIAGFSGGLYTKASGLTPPNLVPTDGIALMVGWLLLVLAGLAAFFSRR